AHPPPCSAWFTLGNPEAYRRAPLAGHFARCTSRYTTSSGSVRPTHTTSSPSPSPSPAASTSSTPALIRRTARSRLSTVANTLSRIALREPYSSPRMSATGGPDAALRAPTASHVNYSPS
ncbi:hypothetical protein FRC12_020511, partial [Ceratobasidium sp. 428]